MTIKDILAKIAKGEALTDAEKAFIAVTICKKTSIQRRQRHGKRQSLTQQRRRRIWLKPRSS
jgi:hypothetical protein